MDKKYFLVSALGVFNEDNKIEIVQYLSYRPLPEDHYKFLNKEENND